MLFRSPRDGWITPTGENPVESLPKDTFSFRISFSEREQSPDESDRRIDQNPSGGPVRDTDPDGKARREAILGRKISQKTSDSHCTGPVSDRGRHPDRSTVKDRKQFPDCPELPERSKPILETFLTGDYPLVRVSTGWEGIPGTYRSLTRTGTPRRKPLPDGASLPIREVRIRREAIPRRARLPGL